MSLNFSIDSILRHGNVESTDSTLLSTPGKLGQTSFLDESTSAFLKKQQQLNYLSSNATSNGGLSSTPNGLTTNSNPLLGDTSAASPSLLQSQLLYLNKTAANPAALGLMADQNGCSTGSSSLFGLELSQLSRLGHLNQLELSRLNQLSQLNQLNQLSQFHYLSKINSLYGEAGSPNRQSAGSGEDPNHPNSSSNSHSFAHHFNHQLNNHLHSATENSSTAAAFLNLANGNLPAGAQSVGSFNTSQCSPLSDKSSEMLLNYEDSSDSNRLSQHSGNNMSINSNNSTTNPKQSANNLNSSKNGSTSSSRNKDKDFPLCTKCKLHGIHSLVKGHKKSCPKKDCMCSLCLLTDYGKRLRGKKGKKAVGAILPESAGPAAALASTASQLTPANLFMMDSLNEQAVGLNSLNHLSNLTNLNSNLSESSLLTSGNASGLQSTTPNSNSNSSCSNLSNTALAAAASSLRPTVPATSSAALSSAMSQPLAGLHPAHQQLAFGGLLENNNALKNYKRIVIHLLKEKLAQDGLNYEQELSKLKITVIYLLLSRFDKSELYKKLAELTNS